jgi:spore coat polysaccharide biosynthesis protein SpsF
MSQSKIVALLQARTGSTRLPGKVLMSIGERPMLARVVERIERMHTLDTFAIATSVAPGDDSIAEMCAHEGWSCFRGPEQDVLERYLRAAQAMGASDIVRITADCPLFSWQQADRLIAQHIAAGSDYAHNLTCWGSGMPLGTGVEVFTLDALERAWISGLGPNHREHVTEYIYENPQLFSIECQRASADLERPGYRLTVDTLDDLHLMRRIQEQVAPPDGVVDLREAIALLDQRPELAAFNLPAERKAS